MTNHLWQSTIFALSAALLALAFRKNRARVRYWIWLSASVKFLIPFTLLISLGSRVEWVRPRDSRQDRLSYVAVAVAQPFPETKATEITRPRTADWAPIAIFGVWALGFGVVTLMRWRGWRLVRAAIRASSPLEISAAVEVRSAPGLLEPGVVGWIRPVLLLPADLMQRLTPHQLEAVLAHELCHVRRRDNLFASIHMIVEALFWFHPLVWWIGARLVDERERACDEEVLRLGNEPAIYAEGILNVCKSYLESPLRCVSGVTGSDLKRRIQSILTGRVAAELSVPRRVALMMAAILAVALPVVVGAIVAPRVRAQFGPITKFEVASIRPCGSSAPAGRAGGGKGGGSSPGTLHLNCQTVENLIEQAYDHLATGKPRWRAAPIPIEQAPEWIKTDRYTIDAKSEKPAGRGTMGGPMMQALLEDRLKLKIHRDPREVPVYLLKVARGGPKNFSPAKDGVCMPLDFDGPPPPLPGRGQPMTLFCGLAARRLVVADGSGMLDVLGTTFSNFAEQLSVLVGRDVIDRTGISGSFDIHAEVPAEEMETPPEDPARPGRMRIDDEGLAMNAVRRLGLKLESAKGPGFVFVIDHIERPSEN